eukprot:9504066-Pyramimonas_sp.AAC.2
MDGLFGSRMFQMRPQWEARALKNPSPLAEIGAEQCLSSHGRDRLAPARRSTRVQVRGSSEY